MSLTHLWKARLLRGGHADAVPDHLSGTIRAADGMPCGTALGTALGDRPGARRDEIDDRRVRRTPVRQRLRAEPVRRRRVRHV